MIFGDNLACPKQVEIKLQNMDSSHRDVSEKLINMKK